jgi:hypothetical protein
MYNANTALELGQHLRAVHRQSATRLLRASWSQLRILGSVFHFIEDAKYMRIHGTALCNIWAESEATVTTKGLFIEA